MKSAAAFRGQPLLLLAGVLIGWLGLRAAIWQSPLQPPFDADGLVAAGSIPSHAMSPDLQSSGTGAANASQATSTYRERDAWIAPSPRSLQPGLIERIIPAPLPPPEWFESSTKLEAATAPKIEMITAQVRRTPSRAVVGHNLLLAVGLAEMEIPPFLLAYLQQPTTPGVPAAAPSLAGLAGRGPAVSASRWSGDGWLMLRDDTITPIQAGLPSYGRSQAGAVVRYRLATASQHRPQAYLRASTALAGPREREVAVGVSVRVLPRLPVRFAAEARAGETAAGAEMRPAVYAVTELPQIELPFAARGEVYAQAGYVGGNNATAFVDGQARVERTLLRRGETGVSAGAGAWGGAQKEAARLDIGPTATLTFRVGGTYGRLAADYRFRVAGDAEPKSGPALTLSAGF